MLLNVLGGYSSIFDGLLMTQWSFIKMDDLNNFYGLINCPPFPSLILLCASQALGIFLTCLDSDFFIFNYFLFQKMVVFLQRLLSICLLKVFLDVRRIIAWSWKWASDDHFLSLLKSEVISLDDHFLSLRCFFFHSFSGYHVWYSWFACDLHLCENPCLLTLV